MDFLVFHINKSFNWKLFSWLRLLLTSLSQENFSLFYYLQAIKWFKQRLLSVLESRTSKKAG